MVAVGSRRGGGGRERGRMRERERNESETCVFRTPPLTPYAVASHNGNGVSFASFTKASSPAKTVPGGGTNPRPWAHTAMVMRVLSTRDDVAPLRTPFPPVPRRGFCVSSSGQPT